MPRLNTEFYITGVPEDKPASLTFATTQAAQEAAKLAGINSIWHMPLREPKNVQLTLVPLKHRAPLIWERTFGTGGKGGKVRAQQ